MAQVYVHCPNGQPGAKGTQTVRTAGRGGAIVPAMSLKITLGEMRAAGALAVLV